MDRFRYSRCPNDHIIQPNITGYFKVAQLPSWWQKLELKDLSIYEPFKEVLSWNSESKVITPKYITGSSVCAIVSIFNLCFSVCFRYVMFFLTQDWASKAGPCHLFYFDLQYKDIFQNYDLAILLNHRSYWAIVLCYVAGTSWVNKIWSLPNCYMIITIHQTLL